MSLDVHVMPLWRFFSGRYTLPGERAAQAAGIQMMRIGVPKERMSIHAAYEQERALHAMYASTLGISTVWTTTVPDSFSERFDYFTLHSVRAYAAYLDHPTRTGLLKREVSNFAPTEDPSRHPSLLKVLKGKQTTSPHLIHHEDNGGWYLPTDFPHPLPAYGNIPATGSAVALAKELETLAASLGINFSWTCWNENASLIRDDDPLGVVRYGIIFLLHCAKLSLHYCTTMIYDG